MQRRFLTIIKLSFYISNNYRGLANAACVHAARTRDWAHLEQRTRETATNCKYTSALLGIKQNNLLFIIGKFDKAEWRAGRARARSQSNKKRTKHSGHKNWQEKEPQRQLMPKYGANYIQIMQNCAKMTTKLAARTVTEQNDFVPLRTHSFWWATSHGLQNQELRFLRCIERGAAWRAVSAFH